MRGTIRTIGAAIVAGAALFGGTVSTGVAASFDGRLPQLILNADVNGVDKQQSFACAGFVYGTVITPEPLQGKHVLEATWSLPNGVVAHTVATPLDIPPPGRRTVAIWLRFNDRNDGLLGGISGGDSPSGSGAEAYNGVWRVSTYLDGRFLVSEPFNVRC